MDFNLVDISDCPSLRASWTHAALRIVRRRKSSRFGYVNPHKLPAHYTEVSREEETTVGRDATCDIVIRDFAMAPKHAVVYFDRYERTCTCAWVRGGWSMRSVVVAVTEGSHA